MEQELVRYEPGRTLTPVMNLTLAKSRLKEFQEFVAGYMVEGEDYGLIPGTQKKTLYKPGADKLCELYGLTDSYRIIDRLVDFDRGLFDYEIECTLSRDGPVATGLGSCSSFEGKYRWRDSKYKCPSCSKETIIKGKEDFGGGWLCFKKKGGCGAKFEDGDQTIEGQIIGPVENEDIATLKNTILKMAKKRAKVDATLAATRSSGVFTQDVGDPEEGKGAPVPIQQPQRKSEAQTQPATPTNGNLISDKQLKRIWGIGYAKNEFREPLTQTQINAIVGAFGFAHANEVTLAKYDALIEAVKHGKAAEVQTDDGDPGPEHSVSV